MRKWVLAVGEVERVLEAQKKAGKNITHLQQ